VGIFFLEESSKSLGWWILGSVGFLGEVEALMERVLGYGGSLGRCWSLGGTGSWLWWILGADVGTLMKPYSSVESLFEAEILFGKPYSPC